jgi:hypothetical protein
MVDEWQLHPNATQSDIEKSHFEGSRTFQGELLLVFSGIHFLRPSVS